MKKLLCLLLALLCMIAFASAETVVTSFYPIYLFAANLLDGAEGVTLTTYENGAQVLVNNTDAAYVWNDTEIAPRDFLLKGE